MHLAHVVHLLCAIWQLLRYALQMMLDLYQLQRNSVSLSSEQPISYQKYYCRKCSLLYLKGGSHQASIFLSFPTLPNLYFKQKYLREQSFIYSFCKIKFHFCLRNWLNWHILQQILMQIERIIVKEQINSATNFQGEITINVQQPLKNQDQTFPYFTYNIVGSDLHGSFAVRRRYRDFHLLRTKLSQRWLGIYIPPISGKRSDLSFLNPFKKLQSKNDNAELRYAQTRKRFLKYFCEGIVIRPYLYYCDLFQIFLRGGPDYEAAIKSCLQKQYSFILNEYQKNFKTLVQQVQIFDLPVALAVSQQSLKQLKESQQRLIKIYQAILKSICARNQFNQQFNVFMTTSLPQYEQKIFINHVGKDRKKLYLCKNQQFGSKFNEYKIITAVNPQELFLQLVAYEIRQTKAFIQAIEGRKEAQRRKNTLKQKILQNNKQMNTLTKGGFTLRSVFKSGSKDLQVKEIEIKIEIRKNQLNCIEKMIIFMVANTNYELMQFKLRRGKSYGQLMKTIAQKELTQLSFSNDLLNLLEAQA